MLVSYPLKTAVQILTGFSLLAMTAMLHADPIDGYWIYFYNQKPKYAVYLTTTPQGVNGVLVAGTKNHKGATVLRGVMPQGNGRYSGGQAYNPLDGSTYQVNLTLNGEVLTMRTYKGIPALGVTATLKRPPKGVIPY